MIAVDASAILEVLLRTDRGDRIEDRLLSRGESLHAPHLLDGQGLELRAQLVAHHLAAGEDGHVLEHLRGGLGLDEAVALTKTDTRQYAKRQMTWFRGMERKGISINWIDSELIMDEKIAVVMQLLCTPSSGTH